MKKNNIFFFLPFLLLMSFSKAFAFAENFKFFSDGEVSGLWKILTIIAAVIGVVVFFHAIYKILIEDKQGPSNLGSEILYLILGLILISAPSW